MLVAGETLKPSLKYLVGHLGFGCGAIALLSCASACHRGDYGDGPVASIELTAGPGLGFVVTDRDSYYDGSEATMDCIPLLLNSDHEFGVIDFEVFLAMDHRFVGDLVVKLFSPSNTSVMLMSRPGLDEPEDSYHEPNGYASNLSKVYPVHWSLGATVPAEEMGKDLEVNDIVCRDDTICSFSPHLGKDNSPGLEALAGEILNGRWRICFADGDSNDVGIVDEVRLTLNYR